jgi:hypothetical protein
MDWLNQVGDFANSAASATKSFSDAFNGQKQTDKVENKAKGDMNWTYIGLALGGVLVVAVVLRLVFRR